MIGTTRNNYVNTFPGGLSNRPKKEYIIIVRLVFVGVCVFEIDI